MNTVETISTQITLPFELYQAIAQRAQAQGKSINSEIVALLSCLLPDSVDLAQEFAVWEAASDEDWLNMETILATQEN